MHGEVNHGHQSQGNENQGHEGKVRETKVTETNVTDNIACVTKSELRSEFGSYMDDTVLIFNMCLMSSIK
jgi:hypothetical protein